MCYEDPMIGRFILRVSRSARHVNIAYTKLSSMPRHPQPCAKGSGPLPWVDNVQQKLIVLDQLLVDL